jgi:hypothetical protein
MMKGKYSVFTGGCGRGSGEEMVLSLVGNGVQATKK